MDEACRKEPNRSFFTIIKKEGGNFLGQSLQFLFFNISVAKRKTEITEKKLLYQKTCPVFFRTLCMLILSFNDIRLKHTVELAYNILSQNGRLPFFEERIIRTQDLLSYFEHERIGILSLPEPMSWLFYPESPALPAPGSPMHQPGVFFSSYRRKLPDSRRISAEEGLPQEPENSPRAKTA